MKFILILLIAAESGATSMATAEFDSKAACQAAAQAFNDHLGTGAQEMAWFNHTRRFTTCVPKGKG